MEARSLRRALTASAAFHGFLALFLFLFGVIQLGPKPAQLPAPIWIDLKPENLAQRPDHLEQSRTRNRIVQTDVARPTDQAAPDSFLGEKNQIVDRETVSKNRITEMGASNTLPKAKTKTDAKQEIKQALAEKTFVPSLDQLGVPILPMQKKQEQQAGNAPEWTTYGALPQDYVPGVKESEHTALNTKEYAFYGYFQRIRERLDRAWVNTLRARLVKLYRSGRTLASDMDYATRVMVTLNVKGEITRVQVVDASGAHDLDTAAVQAFNQAGPFPNPPHGIVDAAGEIQIPWEFILKT